MKLKCEKYVRNYGGALNLVLRSRFSFEPLPWCQDYLIMPAQSYYLYTKYKKTEKLLGCLTLCQLGFVDLCCNDTGYPHHGDIGR
jgi:hypothetical protein